MKTDDRMKEVVGMILVSIASAIIVGSYLNGSGAAVAAAKDSSTDAKPVFKSTSKNITVGPGDRAVLRCKVENLGTKTVTWRKQDEVHPLTIGLFQFAPDTRITVDHNQRTMEWSLTIQDIKASDEGVYRCQISTKYDKYSYDIRLNVKTIQVTGTEYVERGSPIQLVCNVTGKPDPPLNIDWYKGQNKVKSDTQSGVIITKKIETKVLVSMLLIRNSQPEDSGEYTCKSSDRESSSIRVHVLNTTMAESRQVKGYIRSTSSTFTRLPPGVASGLLNALTCGAVCLLVMLVR